MLPINRLGPVSVRLIRLGVCMLSIRPMSSVMSLLRLVTLLQATALLRTILFRVRVRQQRAVARALPIAHWLAALCARVLLHQTRVPNLSSCVDVRGDVDARRGLEVFVARMVALGHLLESVPARDSAQGALHVSVDNL